AISTIIELDDVLREIVDSVSHVFDARLCALWIVPHAAAPDRAAGGDALALGAARAELADGGTVRDARAADRAAPLRGMAAEVAAARARLHIDDVAGDPRHRDAAAAADIAGALLAAPLERKAS